MLVLDVNSKRQRRPNVRLVEIGDASAAFSCGISQKRLKPDRLSQFGALEPLVSPRVSAEAYNRENRNPNSGKAAWEFAGSEGVDATNPRLDPGVDNPKCDIGEGKLKSSAGAVNTNLDFGVVKPKLDFGTIIRRGRAMKHRGWSMRGNGGIGIVGNWRASPDISNLNDDHVNGHSKGSTSYEASDMSKDACDNEWFEPVSDVRVADNSDDFGMANVCKESNGLSSDNGDCLDRNIRAAGKTVNVGMVVDGVRMWLEELGFGMYAALFKMHEVDEETLPLLTLEDLKEMGINAVGPRRKIFTAIQLLKERAFS